MSEKKGRKRKIRGKKEKRKICENSVMGEKREMPGEKGKKEKKQQEMENYWKKREMKRKKKKREMTGKKRNKRKRKEKLTVKNGNDLKERK